MGRKMRLFMVFALGSAIAQYVCAANDITQLSIEELMQREVTSVSRTTQNLSDAPAAVFVINAEDIRRSGATIVPEVLRMVPGLHVARLNSNQWAITARGFNGQYANKLLVLIDGRSVYTPIFSGVYWEAMDMPLDDIERIEVIRGPGASLWGANAVNGIINIITKSAADTLGGLVDLTIGDEDQAIVNFRYGGQWHDQLFFRGYGKYAKRDAMVDLSGRDSEDEWDSLQGGFRLDWQATPSDAVVMQGSYYDADIKRRYVLATPGSPSGLTTVLDDGELSTFNLSGRWEHTFSLASRTALQLYYQREVRDDVATDYSLATFDIDFQHEFALSENQEFIWGVAYRYHEDDFGRTQIINMSREQRDYDLFSFFVQDRVDLFDDRLQLTFGAKIERHEFTGWEIQPSVRALWKPAPNQRLWAAVSRAARSPSRGDVDVDSALFALPGSAGMPPSLFNLRGNEGFNSEEVTAYEVGYRTWPADNVYIDVTAFYNDYDDLRFATLGAPEFSPETGLVTVPVLIDNAEEGKTYGFEVAADWRPAAWWRLQLGYSYWQGDFRIKDEFAGLPVVPAGLGNQRHPRHQYSVRSSFDLPRNIEIDFWLRYVDDIPDIQTASAFPDPEIDDYLTLDVRLGWRPDEDLEFSLVGRNLIDSANLEFLQESNTFATQIERSFYGQVKWRF